MASQALAHWHTALTPRLDELEALHSEATGTGPGRRWGTQQLNGQLFVALVGQFQGYARSLHDEALDWLRPRGPIAAVLAATAAQGRQLDRGNPSAGSLGQDFLQLGLQITNALRAHSRYGGSRLDRLEAAVHLRNGIAHADEAKIALAGTNGAVATLPSYRRHRRALDHLAVDMDAVVAQHLSRLGSGPAPW